MYARIVDDSCVPAYKAAFPTARATELRDMITLFFRGRGVGRRPGHLRVPPTRELSPAERKMAPRYVIYAEYSHNPERGRTNMFNMVERADVEQLAAFERLFGIDEQPIKWYRFS